jgi:hypothetical protein
MFSSVLLTMLCGIEHLFLNCSTFISSEKFTGHWRGIVFQVGDTHMPIIGMLEIKTLYFYRQVLKLINYIKY